MSTSSGSTPPDSTPDTICPLLITYNKNEDAYFQFPKAPRKLAPSRKRAVVACLVCRSRKVRCNVAETGPPCTNCRLDGTTCAVEKMTRKRSMRTIRPPAHLPHLSDYEKIYQETRNVLTLPWQPPKLPNYIRSANNRLTADDVQFLARKGAFTIPPVGLRDQLLKAYAEFAHPHLPFINICEIINNINNPEENTSTGGTSLLLFQTIMACGSVTVEMQHLIDAGYTTRHQASTELFSRVRSLYDFDYESERVAIIQSLTLMCYWFQTPDCKDRYHWLTVAVSLSYTLHMQHDPGDTNTATSPSAFHKRLWWCVYTVDKIISASLQRAALINIGDFSIPMLKLADFDQQLASEDCSCLPPELTMLHDAIQQHQLAVLFIEKAKLSICLGNILKIMYAVRGTGPLRCCDGTLGPLNLWKQGLHAEAKYISSNSPSKSVFVQRCHLHLIYLRTLRDLYQAQHAEVVDDCNQCVWPKGAFGMIGAGAANIAKQLDNADLLRCLPPGGVMILD